MPHNNATYFWGETLEKNAHLPALYVTFSEVFDPSKQTMFVAPPGSR